MRKITLGIIALTVAASAAAIEPGNWEASSETTDIQLSGDLPPQVANMIRDAMNDRRMTSTNCITQDQIDNAPENLFQQSEGQCRYTEFSMSGGSMHGVAQCNMDQGTMNMTMDGTYTASTYDMDMTMTGDMGMGPMSMAMHVTGQRIGECS